MFDVLAIIALIVGFFGISNTLTMNIIERTREIGMLRGTGNDTRSGGSHDLIGGSGAGHDRRNFGDRSRSSYSTNYAGCNDKHVWLPLGVLVASWTYGVNFGGSNISLAISRFLPGLARWHAPGS